MVLRRQLGFHRLTAALVILLVATLTVVVGVCLATGLRYDWRSQLPFLLIPGGPLLAWLYFVLAPGRQPADWLYAESFLVVALMLGFMFVAPPGQYAMVALGRPLVDPALVAADRLFGVDVTAITAWTHTAPRWFIQALFRAYRSFGVQLFLPVLLLGFWYRRRLHLWEYLWHFYICSIGVLVVLALWPAAGPPLYFGDRLVPMFTFDRYAEHFRGVYSGALRVVPSNMDGLVSLPSFHTAAAIMVTWAFRFSRLWLCILVPVNLLLIAATVMSGAHYAVDLLATGALFGTSLLLWRLRVVRWI